MTKKTRTSKDSRRRQALTALSVLCLGMQAQAAPPIELTSTTRGFAFSYFWYDVYESPQDCPHGYAMALRDVAIKDLPQEEQARLLRAENRSEYYKLGYALAAKRNAEVKGTSPCDVPEKWADPPHRMVEGKHAFGENLDGKVSREDFISPDGKIRGVDNQLYRVMGCVDSYRRDPEFAGGAFEDYHVGAYRDGEVTTLMEVRGLDDPKHDDAVEVGIYSSHDPTLFDSKQKGLPYASLTITSNPAWRNETRGKVVDGVLTTEPFDLRLKFGWSGRKAEYYIRGARVRLELQEDGTAKGGLVGYYDVKAAYDHLFRDASGALQVANGFTCPAVHKAIFAAADGYPDPQTGKLTAISTSMRIEAVPAFVIHASGNDVVEPPAKSSPVASETTAAVSAE